MTTFETKTEQHHPIVKHSAVFLDMGYSEMQLPKNQC